MHCRQWGPRWITRSFTYRRYDDCSIDFEHSTTTGTGVFHRLTTRILAEDREVNLDLESVGDFDWCIDPAQISSYSSDLVNSGTYPGTVEGLAASSFGNLPFISTSRSPVSLPPTAVPRQMAG